jgi:hypothetical protein
VSIASSPVGVGRIRLSDGAVLKLKILIVDVRESGFSPFGGVNFDAKIIGGVAVESVPEEVKKLVTNKPLAPSEPPTGGWELLDIIKQKPAEAWEVVKSSKVEKTVTETLTTTITSITKSREVDLVALAIGIAFIATIIAGAYYAIKRFVKFMKSKLA